MSQYFQKVIGHLKDALNEAFINKTVMERPTNPSPMHQKIIGSTVLTLLSLLCIFIAAYKAVFYKLKRKNGALDSLVQTLSHKDTMMMPLTLSVTLFMMFIVLKFVPKEYLYIVLSFFILTQGCISLSSTLSMILYLFWPKFLPKNDEYDVDIKHENTLVLSMGVASTDFLALLLSLAVTLGYAYKANWVLSNIIAIGFVVFGISVVGIGKFYHAATLFIGLFIYDIFWVFGTNVMMLVATKINMPVLLKFPVDIFEKGIYADKFSMIGLGDIFLPGIYAIFMLNYDISKNNGYKYFGVSMAAYLVSLILTNVVMLYFKAGQPALLYIVPCLLISSCVTALIRGEFKSLLQFEVVDESSSSTTPDQIKEKTN